MNYSALFRFGWIIFIFNIAAILYFYFRGLLELTRHRRVASTEIELASEAEKKLLEIKKSMRTAIVPFIYFALSVLVGMAAIAFSLYLRTKTS